LEIVQIATKSTAEKLNLSKYSIAVKVVFPSNSVLGPIIFKFKFVCTAIDIIEQLSD